jgi:hypothetical protein
MLLCTVIAIAVAAWLVPTVSTAAQHPAMSPASRHAAAANAARHPAAASARAAVSTAAQPVNYCQVIPIVNVPREGWGFHAGHPVSGAAGAYTRGHGTINLHAETATGVICQVVRPRGRADREIVMRIGRHVVHTSHHAVRFGVPGNIMTVHVRVHTSTDPGCKVGTKGRATVFASYNNVHRDGVRFTFAGSCRDQQRHWSGPSVVTNVPPN